MQRTLLLAKIHSCTLTAANLNYVGSIIDQTLLEAAGILPTSRCKLSMLGERLITYAIAATASSNRVKWRGSAAGNDWRSLNIMTRTFTRKNSKPIVPRLLVDDKNQVVEVRRYDDLLFIQSLFQSLKGIHTEPPRHLDIVPHSHTGMYSRS